ncbi:MAG TPA: M15 family metallopeptidase [Gemmatimonadales bacterium]|jgi:D-alanyl-D-alanine dipeptidase|nr:M15 family metallopeptidase [Gemmatimonadales bacterium]
MMIRLPSLLVMLAVAACAAPAPSANAAPQATAPDAAADSLLLDVRQADSTIQVELRYATANNFTGAVLPGYTANRAFLRREAALALGRVQRSLHGEGLSLRIYDAYRPVRATLAMVAWAERTHQVNLLDDGYIARRSRHNMGVAVDLTLVDLRTGQPLAMGTPFDTFSPAAHTRNASGEARANRQRLVHAMAAGGWTNYEEEWWHFTYPVPRPVPFDRVIR